MESPGALIEIEPQECRVCEEVAAEGDSSEGNVGGSGDILPFEFGGVEFTGEVGKLFGAIGRQGECWPSSCIVGFAILKIGYVDFREGTVEE